MLKVVIFPDKKNLGLTKKGLNLTQKKIKFEYSKTDQN